jgi:hypothetical protein|tara:strand:+ start:59 stop:319 length:261 start_codon:yes stop_codon:yes gene_type:complete
MIAAIEYWDKVSYTTSASEIKRTENWEDTKEGIFKKFDKQNNRLRYCNGSYFKFEDETLNTEYLNWYKSLSESVKFNMYYGNGIVD